jgi:hypothetical protein
MNELIECRPGECGCDGVLTRRWCESLPGTCDGDKELFEYKLGALGIAVLDELPEEKTLDHSVLASD